MNLSLFLFLIGILGFVLNRKNIILMIIAIEIMLLAVNTIQTDYISVFVNSTFDINCLNFLEIDYLHFTTTGFLLKPWYVTGITDGDGNFSISIIKNKNKTGWLVIPSFTICAGINPANYQMLSYIKSYFGEIGHINTGKNTYNYHVMGYKNCLLIKTHFIKYPLMTYKLIYFKLWKEVLDLMGKKEHLTESGLLKIISIKSLFKKGLNSDLLNSFPELTKSFKVPDYLPSLHLINKAWLTGFINADGTFGLNISQNSVNSKKNRVIPQIRISQDVISLVVLEAIKEMLGQGVLIKPFPNRTVATLAFYSQEAISFLIQICKENSLQGAKKLDFLDFCKGYEIYLNKGHLDPIEITKLISIVKGMNSGRVFE